MLTPSSESHQTNLFYTDLLAQLDPNDPLLLLAKQLPWDEFEQAFEKHYSACFGRSAKPIRLMVGLLILKQLENLSDEVVVVQFKRNPYYQAFCGLKEFQRKEPCHSTELVKFRSRIGTEGVERIFKASVALHGKYAEEKVVNVDTTVQEKFITYSTDGKLAIKIINRLLKLGELHGISRRRTYAKEIKGLRLDLRFFRHVKKRRKATRAIKRLRTIAGILMRELERQLPTEVMAEQEETFAFYQKVLSQKKNDKDKVYSLHEPQVYCVAKGKDHKAYEYGTKASIVSTAKSNIIVGVASHAKNEHDSKTIESALACVSRVRKAAPEKAVCDRGYRGIKQVGETQVVLPGNPLKRDSRYQKDKKRKQCRRRAAIEPIIGHLKSDYRLSRNYLKGHIGDEINLLMAACAWNLKKWMNQAAILFCALKIVRKIAKLIRIFLV